MEEIKKWYSNFEEKQQMNIEQIEKDIIFKTSFSKKKDIYIIHSILDNKYTHYLEYFYNVNNIKELNKNIKSINILEEKGNYRLLETIFDIKIPNIDIGLIYKKEKIFLEKYENEYFIFSQLVKDDKDSIFLTNKGFSCIHIYEKNKITKIDIILEMESNIPLLLKKIPGLLLINTVKNLKKKDLIQG